MNSTLSLQDTLQAEFCPPLDTSLIAAFLGEYDVSNSPHSDAELNDLRETLSALAAQADHQALADSFNPTTDEDADGRLERSPDSSSSSSRTPDLAYETQTSVTSTSDSSTSGSPFPFTSPLGFLQAAFPYLKTDRLRRALATHGGDSADLEDVVTFLLSSEYIRELEERGLDASEAAAAAAAEDGEPWMTVSAQGKPTSLSPKAKKPKPRTIRLVDVRQSQHARKNSASASRPAPDPWIAFDSYSSRLSELLPSAPPTFFRSYFHNPAYPTLGAAVRASLEALSGLPSAGGEDDNARQVALFTLLEVLVSTPLYAALDAEQRSTVLSDVQLALAATRGSPDDALDIVFFLCDLDADGDGVRHSPATPLTATSSSFASVAGRRAEAKPPPLASTGPSRPVVPASAPPTPTGGETAGGGWTHIPARRAPRAADPLAAFIPAYDPFRGSRKLRGAGNGLGKGGKGDVGELSQQKREREVAKAKRRVAELKNQRNEALREASRAWKGSGKHGGEVASFFAERARGIQEEIRQEALVAAREMVHARRTNGEHQIDLHNTTSAEAIVIVKEILATEGCSSANPLTIITGKGRHSTNGVGILGPTVRNALVTDGWNVSAIEGGLVVRGRR